VSQVLSVMSSPTKRAEWLENAQFCRKMAEQTSLIERRAAWLRLAQLWLGMGVNQRSSYEEADVFDAVVADKTTGQGGSEATN
jgi:hypothetical protein